MPESKNLSEEECINKMISYLNKKYSNWDHDKIVAVAHKECGASKTDALSYLLAEEEMRHVEGQRNGKGPRDKSYQKLQYGIGKRKLKGEECPIEDFERGKYAKCIQRLKYIGFSDQEAITICSNVFNDNKIEDTKLFGEEHEPTKKELKAHKYRYDPRTRHTGGHPTHVEIGVVPRPMALPLQAPHRPMKSPHIMRTKMEEIQTLEERFLTLEELAKRSQYQKAVTKKGKGVVGQKKYTIKKEDSFFVDTINKILDFFPEYNIKDAIEFAIDNNYISVIEDDVTDSFQSIFGEKIQEILDSDQDISRDEAFVKAYSSSLENIQEDIFGFDTITFDSFNQLNNVIKAPITLAREMVQEYKDGKHFKPYNELRKSIEYVDELPIIIEHKRFSDNDVVGYVKEFRADDDERSIKGVGYFIESKLPTPILNKINDGEPFPVSIGFFAILGNGGEFNGIKYDAEQKNIKLNHLALCERSTPRCDVDLCGVNVGDSLDSDNGMVEIINKKQYYLNIEDVKNEEKEQNNEKRKHIKKMEDAVVSEDHQKIFQKLFDFLDFLPLNKREDAENLLNQLIDQKEEEEEEEKKMEKKEDANEKELHAEIKQLKDSICNLKNKLNDYEEEERERLQDSILKFSQFEKEELENKDIKELRIIEDSVSRFDPTLEKARKPKPENEKNFEDSEYKRVDPNTVFSETNKRFDL